MILEKKDFVCNQKRKSNFYTDLEINTVFSLLLFGEIVKRAFMKSAPNIICDTVYNLCVIFNKFYNENHILSEQNYDKKRIAFINLYKKGTLKQFYLLGF